MITRRSTLSLSLGCLGTGLHELDYAKAEGSITKTESLGYYLPLESNPHERTFMQWPALKSIYGSQDDLEAVREKISLIANSILKFEPVVLLARPEQIESARDQVHQGVEIWPIETDDLWARDSGPTFVVNGKNQLAVRELNFNGWGNKQTHGNDARIAGRVAGKLGLQVFNSGLVGEGGGIEFDGKGTAMAHASCWVNANRNIGSRDDIERKLLEAVGAKKIIWAPGVIGSDITDYHIDALARFVKPGQVVIQLPDKVDHNDPWSASAYETYEILKKSRDAEGNALDIVVIPEPVDIRSEVNDFVSSYVNYYVCNGAVISAEFGDDKADEEARHLLSQLYPGREIISLNVDAIGEAGGGIHCSTQQQPKINTD